MRERECDNCKEKSQYIPDTFANIPFPGWIEVFEQRTSVQKQPKQWDFCSLECMGEYFKGYDEDKGTWHYSI